MRKQFLSIHVMIHAIGSVGLAGSTKFQMCLPFGRGSRVEGTSRGSSAIIHSNSRSGKNNLTVKIERARS